MSLLLLVGIWNSLPFLLEWSVVKMAKGAGLQNFEMHVSDLDPWKTKVLDLAIKDQGNSLRVKQIDILYDPSTVALGEINALSITGLSGRVNTDTDKEAEGTESTNSYRYFFDSIDQLLINSPLSHFRLRNSDFTLIDQNISTKFNFGLAADFLDNLIHFVWEGSANSVTGSAELSLSREENSTFLAGVIEIENISQLFDEISSDSRLQDRVPEGVSISEGQLLIDIFSRVLPDGLEDVFLELNGSNIGLEIGGNNFTLSKLITFITPENDHKWVVNSYANINHENILLAEGINLAVSHEGNSTELSSRVNYLKTQGQLPPIELNGVRFPNLEFDLSDPLQIPYGKELEILFHELSYGGNLFKLYDGVISFLFLQDHQIKLSIPPVDASLLDLGISFVQFSYFGMLDLDLLPQISIPQIISGKRVIFGDEVLLENLDLTFSARDFRHILLDTLSFKLSESIIEFNPANIMVEIPSMMPGALHFDFNKSSLFLPDDEIILIGLDGEINLNSLEPLETNGTQTLSFDRCSVSGVELKDGNFSFQILPDGTFLIVEAYANLYGGVIGLLESQFNLYQAGIRISTSLTGVNGQEIADLIEGLDVEVNGTFSGRIPLIMQGGNWDFEGGYLQLDPTASAKLKYKSNGFLTNGIEVDSEEYKRMRMTELALENLNLESLRLIFEVKGEDRQISGTIRGKSLIDKKTEVSLDYRPKIIAGLAEILHKLNFDKLDL
ncbi:YdbH domain-containing protein [Opitutales bacterium]|nr:YdbH domain-containing protein [Opitutales bacterium]